MDRVELRVEGMTCGGCVKSVQNALTSRNGVDTASADLESGIVTIEFDGNVIQQAGLKEAIQDAGFDVAA